ncbi:PTPDL family protein [Luteolibacter sp. LG18]|uniref:PTPDL family protein n=1 Tax=Luteolibacter sp. LG18 TaxID=2819286 RepID=UPI0030C71626
MKPTRSILILLSAGLLGSAAAETIRLKDGTKLEGKILKEDTESYVVDVQVTRSIREEKTIKKADVAGVDREQLDEKAFLAIKGLVPTPDLLTAADYDARLAKVREFVQTYPTSPQVKAAKEISATLEKERESVNQGGVKLGGHLITDEERSSNKFDVDARMIEVSIRSLAKDLRWAAALREFEKLEKEYQTSAAYKEVLPFVKDVIRHYRSEASEAASTYDARFKKQQTGLELQKAEDRAASASAIADRDAQIKAQYDAEKKASVKWITANPYLKVSLDEAVKYADQELKRLDAVKLDTLPDGGKAWREAWTAVHAGGDLKSSNSLISAARTAKLPDRYVKELEAAAKEAGGK